MRFTILSTLLWALSFIMVRGQDYFTEKFGPFDPSIPTPEAFLGYPIGSHHTRHDQIVAYLERLSELSDRAILSEYGRTYGHRKLVMLSISTSENILGLDEWQQKQLSIVDPRQSVDDYLDNPIFINLGYNVHGNEPSGSEAALLTAYIMVASSHPEIERYREQSIIFLDPTINPDGRDRHTHWANMHKGSPPVSDPLDIEHNEGWPRGRTNHYWFDLNRDWWLAIHPESRGKLAWYHQWYPNVVTDFHEMGTGSTHFFEPMKTNGSKDPIMPEENYTTLNDTFATYFVEALDDIGSFYFTKEVFDGTYPGYGSSYPDLQGGLGLLFEQASSRGHVQKNSRGELTFAFTIRNQLTSTMATIMASVEQKRLLRKYQRDFFTSALEKSKTHPVKAYVFGEEHDLTRLYAFIDKLLIHQVKVFKLKSPQTIDGLTFKPNSSFVVPLDQPQFRIVQNIFETYDEYTDSVFYDASAWSLANCYNISYRQKNKPLDLGEPVLKVPNKAIPDFEQTHYAYLVPSYDYNVPALCQALLSKDVIVSVAFKPFNIPINGEVKHFDYGSVLIPVQPQKMGSDSLYALLQKVSSQFGVMMYSAVTGYSRGGIDLGSRYFNTLEKPKVIMLVSDGVSGYEAGEVWHLLDQRLQMPITKISMNAAKRIPWEKYNTLVLVSGSYSDLDSTWVQGLKRWLSKGNTLITTRQASAWAIKNELIKESLVSLPDSLLTPGDNIPYVDAREHLGKTRVGGAIVAVDLDLTHPLAFGYSQSRLPVYRNSNVWLSPSKNPFSQVARYTEDPHIDGFIYPSVMKDRLKPSTPILVSKVGSGRVILFAENPNFRGSWYGTNRLFLNALLLGKHISVPEIPKD